MGNMWSCPSCGNPVPAVALKQGRWWQHLAGLVCMLPALFLMYYVVRADNYTPDANLVVLHHEQQDRGSTLQIVGTIDNRGDKSWKWVKIQADFYDQSGKFVDQVTEHADWVIAPGQKRNFKIDCNDRSGKRAIPQFARYDLQVVDAHRN